MRPRPKSKVTPFGQSMFQDLSIAQRQAETWMATARREDFCTTSREGGKTTYTFHPFKMYMVYYLVMSRTMETVEGETMDDEQKVRAL